MSVCQDENHRVADVNRSNIFVYQTRFLRQYERSNRININKAIREAAAVTVREAITVVVIEDVDKVGEVEEGEEVEAGISIGVILGNVNCYVYLQNERAHILPRQQTIKIPISPFSFRNLCLRRG